ncbi:TonB-dependent receptor domain-containing protein [Pseudomonas sp. NPDC007930]|uniref:TonB-dependent receptor plug domain-containing protein n=1 Tax=Pseudomonas sp. NPDC007930 TaxID=3364417 RepID=UPI0036ECFD41
MPPRHATLPFRLTLLSVLIASHGLNGSAAVAADATPTPTPASEAGGTVLDPVISLGTRRSDATSLNSSAPVDVISAEQLQRTSGTGLSGILQNLLPSFHFPQNMQQADAVYSVGGGSLRGLPSGETLVLINGKRRHTSPLLNIGSVYDRGSTNTDLNAIPVSAIDHIEVLRDGAAAQYGSDAIAGVINVVLKERDSGGGLNTRIGQYSKGDGLRKSYGGWKGFALPGDGFLTLSLDGLDKNSTRSAAGDQRHFYNSDGSEIPFDRHWATGDAAADRYSFALNADVGLSDALRAYGFATYSYDRVRANTPFVVPTNANNRRDVYPSGYVPEVTLKTEDIGATTGLKYDAGNLGRWDFSLTHGENRSRYYRPVTLNPTYIDAEDTTKNYSGQFRFYQNNATLDYVNDLDFAGLAHPVTVNAGVAWRNERFEELAGDEDSWQTGDYRNANGSTPNPGAGYRPSDEGVFKRNVIGVYGGAEHQLTDQLNLGVTARSERYSDFGTTSNGKFTARYDFTPQVALRGTLSSGYRAPSLSQIGYQRTDGQILAGTDYYSLIHLFPADSAAARALGATDLKPEKSTSYSLGLVLRPSASSSVTVDAYKTYLRDRIVLTENLTGSRVRQILSDAGYTNIIGASYFTNGMDTETHGVDVVGKQHLDLAGLGKLDLSAAFSAARTKVTSVANITQLAGTDNIPIGRRIISLAQDAAPNNKLRLEARHSFGPWHTMLAATRYGTYSLKAPEGQESYDKSYGPQWVTDLDLAYDVSHDLTVSVGANNLLNTHPDKSTPASRSTSGYLVKYAHIVPDGAEGSFYYVNLDYRF